MEGGPNVWDSVGVTIVESAEPRWVPADAWTIAARPSLDLGTADGPAEYRFDRLEGILRRADQSLVVADGGSSEIRFYDASGQFIRRVGGPGSGPGEFQRISGLGTGSGDSLWVYDFGARRFTILTAEGDVVRTTRVPDALANVGAVGRLPEGPFVLQEYWSSHSDEESPREGLTREEAVIATMPASGGGVDTLGLFPGREVLIWSENGRAVMSTPLFARSTNVAMLRGEVLVGDQTAFEIRRYTSSGRLVKIFRRTDVSLRLLEHEVERAIEAELAARPVSELPMWRSHFARMVEPDTRPAYSRLLSDGDGNTWVASHQPGTQDRGEGGEWSVFDQEGEWLGTVEMPERFLVHQIGSDWVLGRWRDEMDVEHVRLYELHRTSSAAFQLQP